MCSVDVGSETLDSNSVQSPSYKTQCILRYTQYIHIRVAQIPVGLEPSPYSSPVVYTRYVPKTEQAGPGGPSLTNHTSRHLGHGGAMINSSTQMCVPEHNPCNMLGSPEKNVDARLIFVDIVL